MVDVTLQLSDLSLCVTLLDMSELEKYVHEGEVSSNKTLEEYSQQWDQLESSTNWKKGEILSGVSTSYGDSTLKKFAESKGVNYSTAQNYVQVYRAYPNSPTSEISWSVAQTLAAQLDRVELIESGQVSSVAEARALVKSRKEPKSPSITPTRAKELSDKIVEKTNALEQLEEMFSNRPNTVTGSDLTEEELNLWQENFVPPVEVPSGDISSDRAIKLEIELIERHAELIWKHFKEDVHGTYAEETRERINNIRTLLDKIEDLL